MYTRSHFLPFQQLQNSVLSSILNENQSNPQKDTTSTPKILRLATMKYFKDTKRLNIKKNTFISAILEKSNISNQKSSCINKNYINHTHMQKKDYPYRQQKIQSERPQQESFDENQNDSIKKIQSLNYYLNHHSGIKTTDSRFQKLPNEKTIVLPSFNHKKYVSGSEQFITDGENQTQTLTSQILVQQQDSLKLHLENQNKWQINIKSTADEEESLQKKYEDMYSSYKTIDRVNRNLEQNIEESINQMISRMMDLQHKQKTRLESKSQRFVQSTVSTMLKFITNRYVAMANEKQELLKTVKKVIQQIHQIGKSQQIHPPTQAKPKPPSSAINFQSIVVPQSQLKEEQSIQDQKSNQSIRSKLPLTQTQNQQQLAIQVSGNQIIEQDQIYQQSTIQVSGNQVIEDDEIFQQSKISQPLVQINNIDQSSQNHDFRYNKLSVDPQGKHIDDQGRENQQFAQNTSGDLFQQNQRQIQLEANDHVQMQRQLINELQADQFYLDQDQFNQDNDYNHYMPFIINQTDIPMNSISQQSMFDTTTLKDQLKIKIKTLNKSKIIDRGHQGLNDNVIKEIVESVNQFTSLEQLNLKQNFITDQGFVTLLQNARKFPKLIKIFLQTNQIKCEGLKELSQNTHLFPNLQYIYLDENKITDKGLKTLLQNHHQFAYLATIILKNNQITCDGFKTLIQSGQNLPNLQHIDCSQNKITDQGFKEFLQNAHMLPNLQIIQLNKNNISSEGFKALTENGYKFPKLHTIGYYFNDLTSLIAVQDTKQLPNFQVIELMNNKIGDEGLNGLVEKGHYFSNLQTIKLDHNDISSLGFMAVIENAHKFPKLQVISLQNNRIAGDGLKFLADNGHKFPNLHIIGMQWNGIQIQELTQVPKNSNTLPNLQIIDLIDNKITDQGLIALVENGLNFPKLQIIDLQGNKITGRSFKVLAENGAKLPSLKEINFEDNKVSDKGLIALAENGQMFGNLQKITLMKNVITHKGLKVLVDNGYKFKNLDQVQLQHNQITKKQADRILKDVDITFSITTRNEYQFY